MSNKDYVIDNKDYTIDIGDQNENGFLRIVMNVGKVGVLPYRPADVNIITEKQAVYILRDEAALFDSDSMRSLEGVPVMIGHEWIDEDKQEKQVGSLSGKPFRKGDFLKSEALITDPDAIKAIQERKLSEISPGFLRQLEISKGSFKGFPYDAKFKDIKYNHVALLPAGQARGGHDLSIVYDKKSNKQLKDVIMSNELKDFKTDFGIVKTDDQGIAVLEKVMDACAPLKKRGSTDQMPNTGAYDDALKRMNDLDSQISTLEGERDSLKANLDKVQASLDEKIKQEPDLVQEALKETLEAHSLLNKMSLDSLPENWDQMPVKELKKHVVDTYLKDSKQTIDEKKLTPEYIEGAWRMITAGLMNQKNVPLKKVVDSLNKNQTKPERDFYQRLGFKEGEY